MKTKIEYKLMINEALMYNIQQTSGNSSTKIVQYFDNIFKIQAEVIRQSIKDAAAGKRVYELMTKKSYGFYPSTPIYFVISTSKHIIYEETHHLSRGSKIDYWKCNVSIPKNTINFNHDKLIDMVAESELLGEVEPEVGNPHNKKWRKRDSLNNLTKTDSSNTKKRG